jgi:hypothetical protein
MTPFDNDAAPYRRWRYLAYDRLYLFHTAQMSTGDCWTGRDTTLESMEAERALIANMDRAIGIMEG